MQVLLDGQSIDGMFSGEESIEATLRSLQAAHCPPAKLVVGIRCDDRDVPGDQIAEKLLAPVSSISKLEVFTSPKHELVIGAIAQASAALQDTEPAVARVGELISQGKTTEGIQALGECLGVWQQVHEAVSKSIQMLELDIEAVTINDEPMIDVISKPCDVLTQIKQALTAQDLVLLTDVLQYEFGDVTDLWYSVLARIRQAAEDQRDDISGGEA